MAGRARRLAAIAAWVSEFRPELIATTISSWSNTDRKIPGTRLRHPGKGRHGTRIVIAERASGRILLDHDGSQWYRRNREVEDWLGRYLATARDGRRGKGLGTE